MVEALYIDGSALCSIQAVGAMEYMLRTGMLDGVRDIYCFSFGSLIAVSFCIHRSLVPLMKTLQTYDSLRSCRTIQSMLAASVVFPFIRKFNNMSLIACIDRALPDNIRTLGDVYTLSGINVHILVCSMGTMKTVSLNCKSDPDLDLKTVLMASCAIPFVFSPVQIGDDYYIDGGTFAGISRSYIKKHRKSVHLASRAGMCLRGLNVFEQLYNCLCSVQSRSLNLGTNLTTVALPRSGVMLNVNSRKMQDLFYQGARMASLEFTVHSHDILSNARMVCCGCSAAVVFLQLPACKFHDSYAKKLRKYGVTIVHSPTYITSKPTCICGINRISWAYIAREDGDILECKAR